MDFLIRDPVRSILLHSAGISVVIPDACRYAVHKLIIVGRRKKDAGGQAKRDKDLRPAGILFDALPVTGHGPSLADALEEARDHGPAWELAISEAAETMHKEYWGAFNRMVELLKR
jgi:hypothetical protein